MGMSRPADEQQRMSPLGPGCAKTRAFNLLVESSSQFGQSENQKCWRRLSEEGNRENGSTVSWLAHVFTRPGSTAVDFTVEWEWPGRVESGHPIGAPGTAANGATLSLPRVPAKVF